MKSSIKSVILVMLIIASIYQTSMLWFDYPSDRNFFYNIIDENSSLIVDESVVNYELFYPKQVALFGGSVNSTYRLKTLSKSDDYNLAEDGITIIQQAFSKGVEINGFIPEEKLWKGPHILLMMPFSLTTTILEENLSIECDWLTESTSFERIYIYPSTEFGNDQITVYFTDNSLATRFGVNITIGDEKQLNNSLVRYMEQSESEDSLLYISTKLSQLDMFSEDRLLPINGQYFDLLENLYGDMYFYQGENRDNDRIKKYVDYFFINPEIVWSTEKNDVLRFGDLDAIVSYDSKGMFTYDLIKDITSKTPNLNKAYDILDSFLVKDTLLNQVEYQLDYYELTDTGVVFYFNYMLRGVPIVFENMETDFEVTHPMIVSVAGNSVEKYTRLLWKSQELIIQGNPFEVRFQKPIDQLLLKYDNGNLKIKDMYLGYHISDLSDGAFLQWIVELKDGRREYYELE